MLKPVSPDQEPTPVLVVIGTSVNGPAALQGLLASLPADCDAAFVFAQHLPPDHASMVTGVLAREVTVCVQQVADRDPLEPWRLHIPPPNACLLVEGNLLRLISAQACAANPLDLLLQSAAAHFGPRCIAVLTPGDRSDAGEGLRALQAAGGRVLLPEPAPPAPRTVSVETIPTNMAHLDASGTIVMVNQPWRHFGLSNGLRMANSGVGVNYIQLCEAATGPWSENALPMAEGIRKVLAGELETFAMDYPCHRPEQQQWFRCVVARTEINRGMGAAVLHIDITDQVLLNERLGRRAAALQSACNAMFITDSAGRIDWVNNAMERLSGFSAAELIGRSPCLWEGHDSNHRFETVLDACLGGNTWQGEVWIRNKFGRRHQVKQTVTPIPSASGELDHFVVVHEDITGQKQVEERMLYLAEHDELTGLWNRKSFQNRLDLALKQNQPCRKVGLVVLDLDRFKDTNDTLGHLAGDQVLLEVARRLKQNADADSLARFGGDEFVLVLENMQDREQIRIAVERLLHSFTRPIEIGGRSLVISGSIGVTVYPDDATAPDALLRNADLAMYRAKADGRRGYRFFDTGIESEINDRVEIERELNRIIGTRDLWVAFQPQWDMRTGEVIGVEALLRTDSARLKGISVGRIVSIAEETGLILAIGQSVVSSAVSQLARWHAQGRSIQLSVNLSAVQFHQQDVFGLVTGCLRSCNLPTTALKVEITESVLLNRSVRVRETLHALHGAGIGLVLDDFGTGYSSLSYLREFPMQAVKIDRAFLRGIGTKSNDEAIVRGIIQLAHSMGLTVIAEGVETEEQAAFLRAQQCEFAQGYLFSKALTPGDLDELLQRRPGQPRNSVASS